MFSPGAAQIMIGNFYQMHFSAVSNKQNAVYLSVKRCMSIRSC